MEERRRTILEKLNVLGRVSVKDLSNLLNVSAVTIRQDLRALEEEQLLERTHGGAVLPLPKTTDTPELSFDVRQRENRVTKDVIAQEAATRVRSGDSIALDASTTVFAMLPQLKKLERLIIVTNSLMVAQHCLDSPHIEVFMPGGRLRRDSISLVGSPEELPNINLTAGFFGAHGISIETGITESSMEEVNMKQAVMEHCLEKFFVIDEHKWGKIAPYTLADPRTVTEIITSNAVPSATIEPFISKGVTITVVSTSKNEST